MENTAALATSDVFYILGSILIIVLGIGIGIITVLLTRVLKNLFQVTEVVKDEGKKIIHDVDGARRSIKRNFNWSTFLGILTFIITRISRGRIRRRNRK